MKKIIKFAIVILVLLIIVVLFLLFSNSQPTSQPTQTVIPVPSPIFEIEKNLPIALSLNTVIVGQTTQEEVTQVPHIFKQENLGNEYTAYDIGDSAISHSSQVVVKNGIVVFKRERIDTTSTAEIPPLSFYIDQYGTAYTQLIGSYFYGDAISYFIYPQKGFAVVASAHTGFVYELQFFIPIPITTYRQLYGQDIKPANIQFRY